MKIGLVMVSLAIIAGIVFVGLNRSVQLAADLLPQRVVEVRMRLSEEGEAGAKGLLLRATKEERVLEIWIAMERVGPYKLLTTFPILGMSGGLGPKRKEGDRQVPEGFYVVDRFNPKSAYHLSLGIDYPNASDRILSDRKHPGTDIFIHGKSGSIGCLAMGDSAIEEIYALATIVKENRGSPIAVHIFPFRMTDGSIARHSEGHGKATIDLWTDMQVGWEAFEGNRRLPRISVMKSGRYAVRSR